MSKEDIILKFKNVNRMLRYQYKIYFELVLASGHSCEPSPLDSCTQSTQLHVPCGFGIYVKSIYNIKICVVHL
jgi:hypothetical protein